MIRRPSSGRAAVAMVVVALVASGRDSHAQSRVIVAPSLSVGFVYDDNVFYEPGGDFEAIWRVSSGLNVTRETQRSALFADLSFDVERFRERPALSTPFARQNVSLRGRHQISPRVIFDFGGGFDSTRAPSELNLTTGLLTGRRRAYRVALGPAFTVIATPRTKLDLTYDLTADVIPEGALLIAGGPEDDDNVAEAQVPASRLVTHITSARVTQGITPRNELHLNYVGRWFVPGDAGQPPAVPAPDAPEPTLTADAIITHTALVGWTFRINPAVKIDVAVGPRFVFGRGLRAPGEDTSRGLFGIDAMDGLEAEALLSRQRPSHDVFLSYARTVTTAVGLASLIENDRGVLRAVYRPPFGVQAEAEAGFYVSAIDDQRVNVFHVAGGLRLPVAGPVSIGVSYRLDSQHGRFGLLPIIPDPGNPLLLDPDAPMRRGVAEIRLILAPQLRRTPEDPPTGAIPVRTPPVKRSDR